MTLQQEQALIDYIRANDDRPDRDQYYNRSPKPDYCGHVHCTYHGLCFIAELRGILTHELERDCTDYDLVQYVQKWFGKQQHRGLTELGNVPAWKAESWATSPAGVQIPHPLPQNYEDYTVAAERPC